ncbi:MAG TPA: L,D-transpeptidase family protein [Anaerolineales bacterium]|nr:L,D-transpeptidase family protein [Anaerolineales bacterium]
MARHPSSSPYIRDPRSFRRRAGTPGSPISGLPVVLAKIALVVGVLALLAGPLALALGTYVYFQAFRRIVPGVSVGESRLGGMNVYDAAVEVNRSWNLERRIVVGTLVDGQVRTWEISPRDLGLSVDPLGTAQKAYAVGHGQALGAEVEQMLASLRAGREIAPVVNYDAVAARQGLEVISARVSVEPVEASLHLDGGDLVATPGKPGLVLDVESALEKLSADPLGVLESGYLTAELKPVSPRITDLSAALAEGQRLLDSKVQIKAYDAVSDEHFDWKVPREAIASWLQVESTDQGVEIQINQEAVGAYLDSLDQDLAAGQWVDAGKYSAPLVEALRQGKSIHLLVQHKPTTYTVKPGDTLLKISWKVGIPFWKILDANPGLSADNLLAGQELSVPSKDEMLPLPVIEDKRIVISIDQQHLWVYEDGKQIGEYVISTGIDRSPTQPGIFQVQTHELNAYASVWDLYMPHFLGVYEAWPGFMNGIHGLPTLSSGRRLWAGVLGRPVSYGCIVMDLDAAEWLYNWADNGVVVEIKP